MGRAKWLFRRVRRRRQPIVFRRLAWGWAAMFSVVILCEISKSPPALRTVLGIGALIAVVGLEWKTHQ